MVSWCNHSNLLLTKPVRSIFCQTVREYVSFSSNRWLSDNFRPVIRLSHLTLKEVNTINISLYSIYSMVAYMLYYGNSPSCSSGLVSHMLQFTLQSQWDFSNMLSRTSLTFCRSSTISVLELPSFISTFTTNCQTEKHSFLKFFFFFTTQAQKISFQYIKVMFSGVLDTTLDFKNSIFMANWISLP